MSASKTITTKDTRKEPSLRKVHLLTGICKQFFHKVMVKECRLIQGPIALVAQLALLSIVLTTLVIKRHRERPRRPWNVWSLDISKQAISAVAGHSCGLLIAIAAHHYATSSSECGWYLVVYGIDTTIGVSCAILFHKLIVFVAKYQSQDKQQKARSGEPEDKEDIWDNLVEMGNYGDPIKYSRWGIQTVSWVSCTIVSRIICGILVVSTINYLQVAAAGLDTLFAGHPDILLFFVMVGIPVFMNVLLAWIVDQVLKWKHRKQIKRLDSDAPGTALLSTVANNLVIQIASHQRKGANDKP